VPERERHSVIFGVAPRDRNAVASGPTEDSDEDHLVAKHPLKVLKRAELAPAAVSPLGIVVGEDRSADELAKRYFLVIRASEGLIKGDGAAVPGRHFCGDDLLA
jgi:hypothetical protein